MELLMLESLNKRIKPLIMIVDDSKLHRCQLRDFLVNEGYDVIESHDAYDSFEKLEEFKPDAILLDFVMPNMNGVEACKEYRRTKYGSKIPIIMITSLKSDESVNSSFDAGATDFISKPINLAVLRQRLSRMINAQDARSSLKRNIAFSESIINNAMEGVVTVDQNGKIIYVNPAIETLLGYTINSIDEMTVESIIPRMFEEFDSISNYIDGTFESDCTRKDGSNMPVEFSVTTFMIDEAIFYTLILRDITDRKQYEEKIRHQAFYDALTGLPNRILLKERMSFEITRARRSETKIAVMYLDLDRFKLINDTLGHDMGDNLLKEISNRLIHSVRSDDLVVRLGGDEFLILCPGLNNDEHVGKIANKILQCIKEPLVINKHEISITGSIGISLYPDDGKTQEVLLVNADIAMYKAKEKGKNKFQTFEPHLSEKAIERLEMENNLRRALDYNEFDVYYQPKVNTITEEIIGMEALIRWRHPKLGMIPPDKFIPIAEETGLILPIGEWVLYQACSHNKMLQNAGFPHVKVAVNLSARQFELYDLVETVKTVLKDTGLSPQYLELEITESIAMQNIERTIDIIKELQLMGVRFSIDDFGTGYSSLNQLSLLAVNKLKIDKSFVDKISDDTKTSVIASTVLALGKNLDMQIVAEGVENLKQVEFFKSTDCDELQGYFFGRPMSAESFKKFFADKLEEKK